MAEHEVTKRRVTMTSYTTVLIDGHPVPSEVKVEDYVRPDHLEAYVADARTRWQAVTVSDEPDAGPGGYHGETVVPAHLNLPDAGVTYAATSPED